MCDNEQINDKAELQDLLERCLNAASQQAYDVHFRELEEMCKRTGKALSSNEITSLVVLGATLISN